MMGIIRQMVGVMPWLIQPGWIVYRRTHNYTMKRETGRKRCITAMFGDILSFFFAQPNCYSPRVGVVFHSTPQLAVNSSDRHISILSTITTLFNRWAIYWNNSISDGVAPFEKVNNWVILMARLPLSFEWPERSPPIIRAPHGHKLDFGHISR